jgi:hypothetical protein
MEGSYQNGWCMALLAFVRSSCCTPIAAHLQRATDRWRPNTSLEHPMDSVVANGSLPRVRMETHSNTQRKSERYESGPCLPDPNGSRGVGRIGECKCASFANSDPPVQNRQAANSDMSLIKNGDAPFVGSPSSFVCSAIRKISLMLPGSTLSRTHWRGTASSTSSSSFVW